MKITNMIERIKPLFIDETRNLVKPVVIQFPVIDICNSRCQMCRIWENKKSNDITVAQLRQGLKNELFSEVASIGFNGGEPTLRDDLCEIVETCIELLPKLKQISLITNGYKYLQVIEQIKKIGALIESKEIYFDVMVSLDGFESIHDRVRGRTSNFKNSQHVLEFLKTVDYVNNIRIGCTVIKENAFHLHDLFEYCVKNDLYIKYRQGVPHKRLYTENLIEPYALNFEEKYEFVEFLEGLIEHYETSLMQKYFYRSLIGQIIYNKPRTAGCDWRHRGATITAKGELAFCAVESKTLMEDISQGDAKEIYFQHEPHLKDIIANKCDDCHHDYVGMPKPEEYRKIFMENINERFKIKETLKRLPGFSAVNNFRNMRNYSKMLDGYRNTKADANIKLKGNNKILICGWYGTETLGDKGIIAGVINSMRIIYNNDVTFYIASLFPYVTEMTRRQMVEFKNCHVLTIEQSIAVAADMDCVVFGGGPLMAIDAIAPMQVIFERAKQAGVRTGVTGCGVGPLGDKRYNDSIKHILDLSDFRIYRDEKSKLNAISLGVDAYDDLIAEDPAFTWLKSFHDNYISMQNDKINQDSSENKTLLLGLRDFPWKEYAKHLSENECIKIKDNYESAVIAALQMLISNNKNVIIKPLPMCTNHFGSDDRWFYRKLFRRTTIPAENIDFSLCGREMAPIEYCNEFMKADGLLAMRFHSLVFGLSLGTPSLALDYTLGKGKVKSLAERYGVDVVCLSDITTDKIVAGINEILYKPRQQNNKQILDNLTFFKSLNAVIGK
ncbi:polysaccharide pyruvyl transferase family protein [Pectobacterium carotovorum]|uniref:polysaccharide pyruvyl transferase family protein n=1 Tax=Pectobacterium carotovorum TaxID=554 RepID=UPI003016234D